MKAKDLTGMQFGGLNVISHAGVRGKYHYWNCQCGCGNFKEVRACFLRNGTSVSCGCLKRKNQAKYMSRSPDFDLSRQTCGESYIGTVNEAQDELDDLVRE